LRTAEVTEAEGGPIEPRGDVGSEIHGKAEDMPLPLPPDRLLLASLRKNSK